MQVLNQLEPHQLGMTELWYTIPCCLRGQNAPPFMVELSFNVL